MRKNILDLLQISLLSAILSTIVIYFICTRIAANGLGFQQAAFFTVLPGIIFFIVISITNSIGLYEHRKQLVKEGQVKLSFINELLILSFSIIFMSFLLDYLYFLFDDSLPKRFASVLLQNLGSDMTDESLAEFKSFTFFSMNMFVNSFLIALGVLVSLLVTGVLTRKIDKPDSSLA